MEQGNPINEYKEVWFKGSVTYPMPDDVILMIGGSRSMTKAKKSRLTRKKRNNHKRKNR